MTALRYDPYLWVHLAGLATVPLWLVVCLLGLAVGYPTAPALELSLVLGLGCLPVLYMQLLRPFSIFGTLFLALKAQALGEDRRKLLTVFRSWRVRGLAPFAAILLGWIGFKLYQVAPVAAGVTPFSDWGRPGGLALATVGFFGANLFLQIPVSVLRVLLTSDRQLQSVDPYPLEAVSSNFVHFGLRVPKILPTIIPPAGVTKAESSSRNPAESSTEALNRPDSSPLGPPTSQEQASEIQSV